MISANIVAVGSSPHAWGTLHCANVCMFNLRFIPTRVGNTSPHSHLPPRSPVHPHTRGEHTHSANNIGMLRGSSPHAWGTRPPRMVAQHRDRFIPTRVGNTHFARSILRTFAVHPHTRGEHRRFALLLQRTRGSSPHAWGTLNPARRVAPCPRFIPTRVGNTMSSQRLQNIMSVHPHTRGEHDLLRTFILFAHGSSPHAWGTRRAGCGRPGFRRFIPTRVGNTTSGAAVAQPSTVHPHTRGEHWARLTRENSVTGSSPHAWGTLKPVGQARKHRRFIPTRVGNTKDAAATPEEAAVHPHTRGEHNQSKHDKHPIDGSSPHAWGTHPNTRGTDSMIRFIPTRVGNTRQNSICSIPVTVHPHTRGEHSSWNAASSIVTGSSPHAWGTQLGLPGRALEARFIPTRVGNTTASAAWMCPQPVHPHTRGEHDQLIQCVSHPLRFIPTRVGNTCRPDRARRADSVHPHTRGEHIARW